MKWLKAFVICFSILLLFVSYLVSCKSVGVSDEELTDYTSAVQMNNKELQTPSVSVLGNKIPIVNSPYQGSLKSWIVAPVLKIFGTSVYVNRFINFVLSVIYILCLYWAIKIIIGNNWAILVFLIPILDTKFLLYSPYDFGPFLAQLIFISLSLGGIFRYLKTRNIKWWYFSNFMIGAILAQKLTSFPLFFVLFLVNNFLYLKFRFGKWIRLKTFMEIILSIGSFLLLLLPSIYYFGKYGFTDFLVNSSSPEIITFWSFWHKLWSVFITFLAGFDGVFWAKGTTITTNISSIMVLFPYFSVFIILWEIRRFFLKKAVKIFPFILVLNILSFVAFTLIKGLTRSHHFFILGPLWMLLFFVSLKDFWLEYRKKWWCWISISIVVLGMIFNSGFMLWNIDTNKGAVLTSMAIYDLNKKLELLGAKKVYALNFSLSAPVYYLSNGQIKTVNLTWDSLDSKGLNKYISEVVSKDDTYLIARKSDNYYWSKDWIDWLNRDKELSGLINNPFNLGLKSISIYDERGSTFYIFSKCTLVEKNAKICR